MAVGAMYPGTFDPITNGHDDLVRRAARLFDQVVVAIAESPGKAPLFSVKERVSMAKEVLADCGNVKVMGYHGLTVDFARQHGLNVIVRGLRAVSDFEYEFQMASMNARLDSEVETLFLTASERQQFIASRLVKEIAVLGGDITSFVSPRVAKHVMDRCAATRSED